MSARVLGNGAGAPRRVLLAITTSDIGGAERIVREIALRIDKQQFAASVCSLCPPGRMAEDLTSAGLPVHTLNMASHARPLQLIAAAFRFARLIDRGEVDLVHSFLYRANVVARLGVRLSARRPVMVSGHHSLSPVLHPRAPLASRLTRVLSDHVAVVSQAVRDVVMKVEHVAPERIVVLENGVDTDSFAPADARAARIALGLPPDAVIVGAVGRLSAEKRFGGLIESVARARQLGAPLLLVLVGDGPERSNLEAQCRSAGVADSVKFLGALKDVRPIYAASDIFALTSSEEASPTVLLEAMASGCAAVATAVGGVMEMVEHDQHGLLVASEDWSAFAHALAKLASDAPLRQRLASAARTRVIERFNIAQMVRAHASFYGDALAIRMAA